MFVTLFLLFVTLLVPMRHAQTPQKVAPPVAADEMVFQPSDKIYPRQPQMGKGRLTPPGFDHIVTEWATVAEAAQAYADFSKKEVRVPRALLDRRLSFGEGEGSVASGYVVQSLNWQLPYDGVEIAPLGGGVIGFRAGQSHQPRNGRPMPPPRRSPPRGRQ